MMPRVEIVGLADIAEMMRVSPPAVMKASREDPNFPAPVTSPTMKSRGWDRREVQKYIDIRGRNSQKAGRVGRPPAEGAKRFKLPAEVNAEIERRIRAAGSLAEFFRLAEISDNALRQRLAGKTTWREVELERFAARLGISFEELTGIRRD